MPSKGVWKEGGFEDFSDGTFGNGGQNIYVSRAGVLQRIHRFDIDGDGYVDLLFANSQDMNERPPIYVYSSLLNSPTLRELPSNGAYAAGVADLNGDGYDDLVIGMQHNGTHTDLCAYIYYGAPEGMSERYKIELPVPNCRAVAIGDFDGDGHLDIAFASSGKIRIFYQTNEGFVPKKYLELDLDVTHMSAGDLDGDGCAELYVRVYRDRPHILWGGQGGLDLVHSRTVGTEDLRESEVDFFGQIDATSTTENRVFFKEGWIPKILYIKSVPHLFLPEGNQTKFLPVQKDRSLGKPLIIDSGPALSAAMGDINGDGFEDIVILSTSHSRDHEEVSWVYWGTEKGINNAHRTPIKTISGRDVVIGDLNGNGCDDIVICQGRTNIMFSTESVIYRGSVNGIIPEPVRIKTHDAVSVFIARTSSDKNPEVIFVNHEAGRVRGDVPIYIYYGSSEGFNTDRRDELPGWSAPDAISCDFNDDGLADVFIANCSENAPHLDPGSFLYWGAPNGFSPHRKLVLPTTRTHGVACGDFRHCGYLDLAVAGFSNPELLIFRGGTDGFDLKHPQRISMEKDGMVYDEPRWLMAADLNNDGWLDLVISQIYGYSFVLWGGPDGFSMERSKFFAVERCACSRAADLTGNGWLDLVFGGHMSPNLEYPYDSYLYIYWGGPDGYREDRRAQLPAHVINSIAVADFNNDDILDIFVSSYNSGRERDLDSYIYWGSPGGLYSATNRKRLFCHSVSGCMAADFNEDGWIDLAVASHKTYGSHPGNSVIWWNGPEGFSEERQTLLPSIGPHGMIAVEPANIMDRGLEEYYISSAFELPADAKVERINWIADVPPKTWVRAQLRFAEEKENLATALWQGPTGPKSWFDKDQELHMLQQKGYWVQYRLALGAVNGGNSPRISEVSISYS